MSRTDYCLEGTSGEGAVTSGSVETLALGHGIELDCSFPSLDSIEMTIRFHRWRLWRHVFEEHTQNHGRYVNLGLLRLGVGFENDMFQGRTVWRSALEWRARPRRPWRRLWGGKDRELLRCDPCIGSVGCSTAAHPPEVDDASFGRSQPCTPSILRIHVDDGKRELCDVGSMVKHFIFPEHPPFVFNTVACVGAFPAGGAGKYTDPESIWFNVFLGYYQIDCAKSDWERPFGYRTADGSLSQPEPEDLARLGKSDWNWFSNWGYGVPADILIPLSNVNMGSVNFAERGLVVIGNSRWHELELGRIEVASCYLAEGGQLQHNTVIAAVWRDGFGAPCPRPEYPESFLPTVTNAVIDMAYWEDEDSYHTVLFGGTTAYDADPAFLAAQLASTQHVIATYYADLGFA